jgi:hypothetical protein
MGMKDTLADSFGIFGIIMFVLFWIVSALAGLAVPIVMIWAVVKLVRHFVGG